MKTICIPMTAGNYERLADCIECGCCISACPIALTTPAYLGPAVLAAAQQTYAITGNPETAETGRSAPMAYGAATAASNAQPFAHLTSILPGASWIYAGKWLASASGLVWPEEMRVKR